MPVGDWQFWVVTALALAGAWIVFRAVAPRRRKGNRRKVGLTIERKDPSNRA